MIEFINKLPSVFWPAVSIFQELSHNGLEIAVVLEIQERKILEDKIL